MNLRMVLVLLCVTASGLSAAEIPAGTHVLLEMINTISTRTAQQGEPVYLRTIMPVTAEGKIVVPVDSHVTGSIAQVQRSGRVKGRSALAIRLDTLTLPSGQVLQFAPRLSAVDTDHTTQSALAGGNRIERQGERGKDAANIAIMAGSGGRSFAPAGARVGGGWGGLIGGGVGIVLGSVVGTAATLVTRGGEVELAQGSTVEVALDRALLME